MAYSIDDEYINIEKYSPFWLLNDVPKRYRYEYFHLPFIIKEDKLTPIHPLTFKDLKISKKKVEQYKKVFPTSSTRTVYEPSENCCYKLSINRKITRDIRTLPKDQLLRVSYAQETLSSLPYPNFHITPEIPNFYEDQRYNWIYRIMPQNARPWFSEIKKGKLSRTEVFQWCTKMVDTWLFYANHDLFLEFHSQNIIIDNATLFYRDTGDTKSNYRVPLQMQHLRTQLTPLEMRTLCFDRTVIKQNISHVEKYFEFSDEEKNHLKMKILERIVSSGISFSQYSIDFSYDIPKLIPIRCEVPFYRSQN